MSTRATKSGFAAEAQKKVSDIRLLRCQHMAFKTLSTIFSFYSRMIIFED